MFASCAPALHGRIWRGAAQGIYTSAPLLAGLLCFCCRGTVISALESTAAGILKRLADMEAERNKSEAARKKLKMVQAPSGEEEMGEEEKVAVIHNPILATAPATSVEHKARVGGSAAVQEPPGEDSSGSGQHCEDTHAAESEDPAKVWRMHSDEQGDVWYSNKVSGAVVWELPADGVLKKSMK